MPYFPSCEFENFSDFQKSSQIHACAVLKEHSMRTFGYSHISDDLLLIPLFILDFLCIHPFNDGNGRMSRLLTLLLPTVMTSL